VAIPTVNLSIYEGSLFTATIPNVPTSGSALRVQLRGSASPNAQVALTLTTGGGGLVNNGNGTGTLTILPSQSLAFPILQGTWDCFADPDGVADNASVAVCSGTWSLTPNTTAESVVPGPLPPPAPQAGNTLIWNGTAWTPAGVNYVEYVNPNNAGPAASLTTAAPAITRMGSGAFLISAAACPYATGEPTVISFALFRDSTQLPPRHMNTDTGPGNHSPDTIVWVDVVTDNLPHVYSLVATPQSGDIEDSPNHQWIIVTELT